jgi:shikimate dehydrogenase
MEGDYVRTHVTAAGLADYLAARRAIRRGAVAMLPCRIRKRSSPARWLDPLAARIGAVNTVVPERWALTGYNTDAGLFRTAGRRW